MSAVGERLAAHVAAIAAEHEIAVEHRGRGIAYRKARLITIPPVRGRASYFTALHELGHVLGPNPKLRLDQEVAAWRWALEHAIVDPTPGVARGIARSLVSYRRRALRRPGMVLPEGFNEFIAAVERLA